MIDMHIHLLPGVDDGSKSMEETERMLDIIEKDGIRDVIATPHFYRGYYQKTRCEIDKLVEEVNNLLKKRKSHIKLHSGQEIFIDNKTLEEYESGNIGTLAGTDYMLAEFPMTTLPKDGFEIIYELKIKGVKPIMAHPERYRYIIEKPDLANRFLDEGCLLQINSGSILGRFGSSVKRTAQLLVKNGVCSFIGSDAHSTEKRPPGLSEAMEAVSKIDASVSKRLEENGRILLENGTIEPCSERIQAKRKLFGFFRK